MGIETVIEKLNESDLLTEETKTELSEAIEQVINEAKQEAAEKAAAETETQIRAELAEQFVTEKEALIEALDTKAEEYLTAEVEELKEDINSFRDLEVEYNERFVEARNELADVLKNDIEELVETLDSFLDVRLNEEFEELKEDIDNIKKLQFGAEIYEAFEIIFHKNFTDEDSIQGELQEKEQRLQDTEKELNEAAKRLASMERKVRMSEVLAPLHGKPREVMEAILKNQPTSRLEEAYEHFIGRVLHESSDVVVESEKDHDDKSSVLAEGKEEGRKAQKVSLATGDTEKLNESEEAQQTLPEDVRKHLEAMRRMISS